MRRAASSLTNVCTVPPPSRRLTSGLPVIAGSTAEAGRGIFALRAISAGELIHKATPVALHAPPGRIAASVCPHCLRSLAQNSAALSGGFCSPDCAHRAAAGYGGVQRRLGESYAAFRKSCEDNNLLFPLIAARLACDVAAGASAAEQRRTRV